MLARHFGKQILDTLALAAATDGVDLLDTERVVFGLTHADIGGAVAEAWGLPATIVDGIRHDDEAHRDLSAASAAGRWHRHVVRDHHLGLRNRSRREPGGPTP